MPAGAPVNNQSTTDGAGSLEMRANACNNLPLIGDVHVSDTTGSKLELPRLEPGAPRPADAKAPHALPWPRDPHLPTQSIRPANARSCCVCQSARQARPQRAVRELYVLEACPRPSEYRPIRRRNNERPRVPAFSQKSPAAMSCSLLPRACHEKCAHHP